MMAKRFSPAIFFVFVLVLFQGMFAVADDTCVFTVAGSDSVKPNVILLLDNGVVMEEVNWNGDFEANVDYTPVAAVQDQFDAAGSLPLGATGATSYLVLTDIVHPEDFTKNKSITVGGVSIGTTVNDALFWDSFGKRMYFIGNGTPFAVGDTINNQGGTARILAINSGGYNGFYSPYGYGVIIDGGLPYLVRVKPDLSLDHKYYGLLGTAYNSTTNMATWTINGRSLLLPTGSDGDGTGHATNQSAMHDRAVNFRYSTNYLNWLFYAKDGGGAWLYDGVTPLERESRLYSAKMALVQVVKKAANRVKFSIYQFSGDNGATQQQPLKDVLDSVDLVDWHNSVISSDFWNSLDSTASNTYSPLAEGLMAVGGYFNSQSSHLSAEVCQKNFAIVVTPGMSSMDRANSNGCLTGGVNPSCLGDYDLDQGVGGTIAVLDAGADPPVSYELGNMVQDKSTDGIDNDNDGQVDEQDNSEVYTSPIPYNYNGSTNFDDLAYYMYSHDMSDAVVGFQNIFTYTIGYMGDEISNAFLINASNNGNGNLNLYDVHHPDYGKYHFEVRSPESLAEELDKALAAILERTNAFAAPVVPVTRTTSGDRLYMSFFTPSETGLWIGNVVKFGLNENNQIVDKNGFLATYDNGALKETAEPYWLTIDWAADSTSEYPKANGIHNTFRKIYTYLGDNVDLTDAGNAFKDDNTELNAEILGNAGWSAVDLAGVINFVRGADSYDVNGDGDTTENRSIITADVLHSEPLVYEFLHSGGTFMLDPNSVDGTFIAGEVLIGSGGGVATCVAPQVEGVPGDPAVYPWSDDTKIYTALQYNSLQAAFVIGEVVTGAESGAHGTILANSDRTMVFYGANDGMLHAVEDVDGTEAWSFIPPEQLARLQKMIFETGHHDYIDSSPKIYLKDLNGDGFITEDPHDLDELWGGAGDDQVILICGERKGGKSYFALDITDPESPKYLWRITGVDGPYYDNRRIYIAGLGESWSEPKFGKVKTSDADTVGTPVMVIGGGYDMDNISGNSVLLVNVLTGSVLKSFKNGNGSLRVTDEGGMSYSFASTVTALDTDSNDFLDKIYVGDIGGQMWRFGNYVKFNGEALPFPAANEDVNDWTGERLFVAGCNESNCADSTDNNHNGLLNEVRTFYYPPTVTLEKGYDLVFMATGDRENPCVTGDNDEVYDEVYALKDSHDTTLATLTRDDLVDVTTCTGVSFESDSVHGWRYSLPENEKVLSETTVFYKVLYFTTFLPSTDPCAPGGYAKLYALRYKTGCPAIDFDGDGEEEASIVIGTGIPSKPVLVVKGDGSEKLLVSVGGGNPDAEIPSTGPGVISEDPVAPDINFFYLWWKELVN